MGEPGIFGRMRELRQERAVKLGEDVRMSGRVATQPPNRRFPRIGRLFVGLGLLAGFALVGAAQPPESDPRDDKSPRPPAELNRPVLARKYQIPNKDRAIFQGF